MEYAIVFLPLIGSFISGFFGKKLGDKYCQILTSLLVSISGILSLFIFYKVLAQDYSSNKLIFNWINSGDFQVNWSIIIDPLTAVMLVVVSLISSIIHFYSIGYMSHDMHKARFMAYLSLFTFAYLRLPSPLFAASGRHAKPEAGAGVVEEGPEVRKPDADVPDHVSGRSVEHDRGCAQQLCSR